MNASTLRAWCRLDSPKSRRPKFDTLASVAAALSVAFVVGCQSADVAPSRLTPTRTASLVACVLSSPTTAAKTSGLLNSCAKEVPKIMETGLDQVTIDGVLAGTAGPADPGIRAACTHSGGTRAVAGVETMGYGVVMDGESQRVLVVHQDDVTTYHRDGSVESARFPVPAATISDTGAASAAPSACTMAIVQAVTVASICADQQWAGGGCAALRAHMQYCGDPTRLMVDPDLGFACQPNVDNEAVTTAANKTCERNGVAACTPEVNVNGWLRDPGGICTSPNASVSADKETCVVPISVKAPRGAADITAVILWAKTTSGGPIFTTEPAKPRG